MKNPSIKLRNSRQPTLLLGYAHDSDIQALFQLLGMLAKSDGRINQAEINEAQTLMTLQLPSPKIKSAITCFREGAKVNLTPGAIRKRAFVLYGFRENRSAERWLEPLQVIDALLRVALSDDALSSEEENVLTIARETLGVHKRTYWTLRDTLAKRKGINVRRDGASFENGAATSYSTETNEPKPPCSAHVDRAEALRKLGLKPESTEEEIKRRYRKLVKECHPDLVSAKYNEAQLKEAIDTFCAIQEAYEILLGQAA